MRTVFLRWLILTCCSTSIVAQTPARFRDSVSRETQLQNIEQLDNQPEIDLSPFFGVVDRMLALQDIQAKSFGTAQLADLLWKYDKTEGRQLFERTLKLLVHKPESANDGLLRRLHLRVVQLIAKHDTLWAKRLIDVKSRDDQDSDLGNRPAQNIAVASSLVADEPDTAIDFARRALQERVDPSFIWFLRQLRVTRERDADRLFLQAVSGLVQQPMPNINDFAMLGTYVFTSPKISGADPTSAILTRVGNVGIVDISADRPGISPNLIYAYVATGVELLSRPISDPYQRQTAYALGRLLLPKAQSYAPNLLPQLSVAMSSLSVNVPAELTQDSAFANLKKVRPDDWELMSNAEKAPSSQARDIAYLDVAFHAWLKRDFQTARIATSKISQEQPATSIRTLIDFGEGSAALKRADGLPEAEAFASRLAPGVERSVLFFGISRTAEQSGEVERALKATSLALNSASAVNDARRPYIILIAAGQLARLDPVTSPSALTNAIKDFNSHDDAELRTASWEQRVEIGPLVEKFPLAIEGVDFGFAPAFRAATSASVDEAMSAANALRSETLRSRALVEVGSTILKNLPDLAQNKEHVVRVGEDGIRKSAAKTTMPEYPQDAVRHGKQGVAVAELQYDGKGDVTEATIIEAPASVIGQAVIDAIKQWKFRPSTLRGEPISVRGKLTFYFVLDKDGKGRVENPKQFQ